MSKNICKTLSVPCRLLDTTLYQLYGMTQEISYHWCPGADYNPLKSPFLIGFDFKPFFENSSRAINNLATLYSLLRIDPICPLVRLVNFKSLSTLCRLGPVRYRNQKFKASRKYSRGDGFHQWGKSWTLQ